MTQTDVGGAGRGQGGQEAREGVVSGRVVEDGHGDGHQVCSRERVCGRVSEGPGHPPVAQRRRAFRARAAQSLDVRSAGVHRPELGDEVAGHGPGSAYG
ncbi:hypothetical protein ACWDSL_15035 [Streptomyces sp. NPDC000941]